MRKDRFDTRVSGKGATSVYEIICGASHYRELVFDLVFSSCRYSKAPAHAASRSLSPLGFNF